MSYRIVCLAVVTACLYIAAPNAGAQQSGQADYASLAGIPVGEIICNGNSKTRTRVILQELLLEPGDAFDPDLLAESERKLRQRPYLGACAITPIHDPARGVVDLSVDISDRWSIVFLPAPSIGGGRTDVEIVAADLNFLGRGQKVAKLPDHKL